jgi:hypothetical protein
MAGKKTVKSERFIIGIDPEDIAAPRFTRYWSPTRGFVTRPLDAGNFFDREAVACRVRRLRRHGVRATAVHERTAPWLFGPIEHLNAEEHA